MGLACILAQEGAGRHDGASDGSESLDKLEHQANCSSSYSCRKSAVWIASRAQANEGRRRLTRGRAIAGSLIAQVFPACKD